MKNGSRMIDVACSRHDARSNGVTSDISMNTAPALDTAKTATARMTHACSGAARVDSKDSPTQASADVLAPKIPARLKR